MYQEKGKLLLKPEGSELEQLLKTLGKFIFRRFEFEELNYHDRILYLLLYPDTIDEYDLYQYYRNLRAGSNRFMLVFFVETEALSLLLVDQDPKVRAVAKFRTEVV